MLKKNMSKNRRNEPCPCGSGKKYKKCCLANEYVAIGREESILKRLNQELIQLFEKLATKDIVEDALVGFWGNFDPSAQLTSETLKMSEQNFIEWIVHDWVDLDTGKLLIELYIEASRVLPFAERSVLDMMKSSVLSLFEVEKVFPDKGLLLKDLLLGGEHDVREKAATASLKKWDIFAARIHEVDGVKILSGAVYPYPLSIKEEILGDFKHGFGEDHEQYNELTMRQFMKINGGHYCNFYWYDIFEISQIPQLANTHGHQMVISKAFYEVKNKQSVLESLRGIKSMLEYESGNGFDWLGKPKKNEHETLFGNIFFEKKRMILETNSRERLKKGKTLIKKHVPDVIHKADTFEDIQLHLQSQQGKQTEPMAEIPPEVEQQLINEYMDKHYRQWIKDRIPALGDKTPRQAMRSKRGKKQVIELLKQMENMEESKRQSGRPCYDFSWLWDELGIEREN